MNDSSSKSQARETLWKIVYGTGALMTVLLVALFFIPGEALVRDIDLEKVLSSHKVLDTAFENEFYPIKSVTVEVDGEAYTVACAFIPPVAAPLTSAGRNPTAFAFDFNSGAFVERGFQRGNVFMSIPRTREDPRPREEIRLRLFQEVDQAISSRSASVTYYRPSVGEKLWTLLRLHAEISWSKTLAYLNF